MDDEGSRRRAVVKVRRMMNFHGPHRQRAEKSAGGFENRPPYRNQKQQTKPTTGGRRLIMGGGSGAQLGAGLGVGQVSREGGSQPNSLEPGPVR